MNRPTIKQLLKKTPIPILEAQILLAHILHVSKEYLLAHDDKNVSLFHRIRYRQAAARRKRGVPIAYLIGHKEFFGIDFSVNQHVLIPRPETEQIVDLATKEINGKNQILLIDVGTGSGCIPISIIKTAKHADIKAIAIDSSKSALRVAQRNAARHGVNIEFLHGNLLEPLANLSPCLKPIIITANLPYLTPKQYAEEPSIQREPRSALVGGSTGLELYEQLFKQIQQSAKSYLLKAISCYCEVDPSQSARLAALVQSYLPAATIEIKKDWCGRDRVVAINYSRP